MNRPSHPLGTRARSNWGLGDEAALFTVGTVVYLPMTCPAVIEGRAKTGLHRITSCFSIDEGPSFYYRLSLATVVDGRRIKTDWRNVSDRLHVIPGQCDYTLGWVVLYDEPEREAVAA